MQQQQNVKSSGYVILEGNIGVGKSTFSRLLADALRQEAGRAEAIPEPDDKTNPFLADYYDDPAANAYKMQMHLLHQRFASTRYAQAAALAGKGWYVLDRSYYGDIAFARVQRGLGYFRPAEAESYMDAHRNMREFLEPPTAAVFLCAPPEVCARRIAERARACESGVPLSYLQALDREIGLLKQTLVHRCRVLELDWAENVNKTELWVRARQLAEQLCAIPRDDWDF